MKRLLAPLFLLIATLHSAMAQNVTSRLEIYDLQSRTLQVICEFPFLIEAPNWSPDGKWLLVNKEGRLYRIAPDGRSKVALMARDGMVWLNQQSIADLFGTSFPNISMRISNILKDNELDKKQLLRII